MAIKKELKVKYDWFVGTDGNTVNKWVTVGHIHTSEKGEYMTLEPYINFASLPHGTQKNKGDIRVYVSMFDPQAREDKPRFSELPAVLPAVPSDDTFSDDDIPF